MVHRIDEILDVRKKKLAQLAAAGIDAYPSSVNRTHTNAQALEQFLKLKGKRVSVVGRIRAFRPMGKIAFLHIDDGTARIQILVRRELLGKEARMLEWIDLGDFVECSGKLIESKTKEKTLEATSVRMLAKSLRPLPTEHFGLEDDETRLRQRYLDILLHPEMRELFVKKARFWNGMRGFLDRNGFFELQMPALESVPGGAEAKPFATHHNALDRDFFLRISLELPLKKMLVAGYERVYEIGRIFRNEGIDAEHLQDYTQMECYWAYADFNDLMEFVQRMYQHVIKETFGTLTLPWQGKTIDWSGTWPRQEYVTLFHRYTKLDPTQAALTKLRAYAKKEKIGFEKIAGRGRLIDLIFKKTILAKPEVSMRPSFLMNQPIELEPLAKRDPKNPKLVQRMQVLACGTELGKGFGELNDPVDQRARFEEQMKLRAAGDAEAQRLDEEYLEAMEYGMPPAAGFGVSERLFAVLADKPVREIVVFPPMKSGS